MPDDGPTSERLETLRSRWESDRDSEKTSSVFLQLADEYRRLGRTEDAVRVLEEGLANHPRHPAALVALGRCRLELGRPGEASEVLERVIENDPTQMVAYRLLVQAYVDQGMAEEARQRLRVYSLLNDADPEIAELRRQIGRIERQGREPAGTAPPAAAPEIPVPAEDAPRPEVEEPTQAAAAPGGEPPRQASEDPPIPESRRGVREDEDEPFPALGEPAKPRRPAGEPAGDQVFDLDVEGAPETPAADGSDDLFGLGGTRAAPEPDLSALLQASQEPVPPAPARPEPAAPEPAPAEPAADRVASEEGRATVTLGRLYLRQGHHEEAAAIFREVVDREPDNLEARQELDRLTAAETEPETITEAPEPAASEPAPLTAADLLAGWHGGRRRQGLTERKRYALERYLDRIRGRSGPDVH